MKCRDCSVDRGSGLRFMLGVIGGLVLGGAVLWLAGSPVPGALLLLGAIMGAGGAMRAYWYSRPGGRYFRYRG